MKREYYVHFALSLLKKQTAIWTTKLFTNGQTIKCVQEIIIICT